MTRGFALCVLAALASIATAASAQQTEDHLLTPIGPHNTGEMGISIALDGNVAVLGARGGDNNEGFGSTHIFRFDGSAWLDEEVLFHVAPFDGFGSAVTIEGNIIAVGAPLREVSAESSGAVDIYQNAGGQWTHLQTLTPSNPRAGDYFGETLGLDSGVLVVGSPGDDPGDVSSAGSAYIYRYDGNSFVLEQHLVSDDPEEFGEFGVSVAIDGGVVVIGARGELARAGAVHVYRHSGSWQYEQELLAFTPAPGEGFAGAVAVDGDRVIVGAQGDDEDAPNAGGAYLFRFQDGIWQDEARLQREAAGRDDVFGAVVAIENETAIATGYLADVAGNADVGVAVVFRFDPDQNIWEETLSLVSSDATQFSLFGLGAALQGETAIIGAPNFGLGFGGGEEPGAGYVYNLPIDTDGDGLYDHWETNGIDINNDGVIDLDLPALGADPMHKDLFIEVDIMQNEAGNGTVPFSQTGIEAVAFAFANAPVENPDGESGIDLHVDHGNADTIPFQEEWTWTDFDNAKASPQYGLGTSAERQNPNWEHIKAARKRAYRYCVFANCVQSSGGGCALGKAEMPGNDFIVSLGHLGAWNSRDVANAFMHELGHNLNLDHGGQNDDINYKPNYISVMNYAFDHFRDVNDDPLLPDFSHQTTVTLDESSINENIPFIWPNCPIEQGTVTHAYRLPGNPPQVGHISVVNFFLQDWNHDGERDDSVAIDLNWFGAGYPGNAADPSPGEIMTSTNDWAVIELPIGTTGDFADSVHETTDFEEMTVAIHEWLRNNIPPSPLGSADLTGVQIVTGTILDGDIDSLREADQTHLNTRSGFGETFIDLHHMELLVEGATDVIDPVLMDVMVRSHVGDAGGTAQLRLRNWRTGALDLIGTYGTSTMQTTNFFTDIDASDYVGVNGEIDLSIKHIIHVPFLAYTFESFLDQVQVTVE